MRNGPNADHVRTVRITDPIPTEAQRGLYYHTRDLLYSMARDASYPAIWRQQCYRAWETLTSDKRTVY